MKWFNDDKGFGFITPDGAGQGHDIFVHFTAIQQSGGRRTLLEGDNVQFDIVKSEKGPKAANVTKLG